jgi:polyisoprenoid-binding protein YceI
MQRSRWAAVLVCLVGLVGPALPGRTRAQELQPGASYRVDPARSELAWEVDASLRAVRSRTRALAGQVRVVSTGDDGVSLEGRLEIEAASFETGNERRDRTLRERTLAVTEHPTILFVPHRVFRTSSWAEDESLALEGDLTIRGTTRPVRIPVTLERRGARLVVEGRVRLLWADYAIPDPSFFPMKLRPDVDVQAHLELLAMP